MKDAEYNLQPATLSCLKNVNRSAEHLRADPFNVVVGHPERSQE